MNRLLSNSPSALPFAGLALVALYPVLADDRWLFTASLFFVYAAAAIGLNILMGMGGLVALGQGAFIGIGAYAVALGLSVNLHPIVGAAAGILCAALIGVLVAVPAVRIRGLYLGVTTLGLQIVFIYIVTSTPLAGGSGGVFVELPPYLKSPVTGYVSCAVIGIFTYVIARNLTNSHFGRSLYLMGAGEDSASAVGLRTYSLKLAVFAISAVLGAIAGAGYAVVSSFVDPTQFDLELSILLLAMVTLGGMGSPPVGPVLGALVLTLVPEGLDVLRRYLIEIGLIGQEFPYGGINLALYGITIIVVLLRYPQGLYGLIESSGILRAEKKPGDGDSVVTKHYQVKGTG